MQLFELIISTLLAFSQTPYCLKAVFTCKKKRYKNSLSCKCQQASCRRSSQKPPQHKFAGYLNSPAVSRPPMYGSGTHIILHGTVHKSRRSVQGKETGCMVLCIQPPWGRLNFGEDLHNLFTRDWVTSKRQQRHCLTETWFIHFILNTACWPWFISQPYGDRHETEVATATCITCLMWYNILDSGSCHRLPKGYGKPRIFWFGKWRVSIFNKGGGRFREWKKN